MREGDVIEREGLTLEVLHIPGHDRSEIARFERKRRWVFSGDPAQRGGPGWLGLFTDVTSQRRSFDIPDKEGVPASSDRHEVISVVAE